MPDKHLFEYAVIRVVPCVEREEFLNVGVILYCAGQGFLQTKYSLNAEKLQAFAGSQFDLKELQERLSAFEQICIGKKQGGVIGQLPLASRFRWLAATRSTIVQTSPVHPGLCKNAEDTLIKLHTKLVL